MRAMPRRSKIKKGDQVVVIAGRDKEKRGRVVEVVPTKGKIRIEGINIVKKHQKANQQSNRGSGIFEREAFVDISNVKLIDPQSGKPTRVRYEVEADGSKRRIAVSGGNPIDR
jgi:large subunit ribosomal protein L24